MSPFLTNLLMFSPLLFLAALILYILDRAENLRRGAGLLPPETVDPEEGEKLEDPSITYDEEYDEELYESEGEAGEEEEAPAADLFPGEPSQEGGTENPAPHLPATQPPNRAPRTRTVGAKKARSLARRDQRRAYHEFLQSQQSERARRAAEVGEEEEERLFEEKRRRALVEEEITVRREQERVERIEAERKREEERRRDVDRVRVIVTARGKGEKKAWSLEELAKVVGRDQAWVKEALKLEGLVGGKEGEWRMITAEGWYVVVGEAELRVLYTELEKRGKMEWKEMAKVLEEAVA